MKVIRENGTRKAVVELVVKTAVWTVSYRLGEKEVLSGSVEAAVVNPTVTANNLRKDELKALDKMFYKLPGGCQGHHRQRRCDRFRWRRSWVR